MKDGDVSALYLYKLVPSLYKRDFRSIKGLGWLYLFLANTQQQRNYYLHNRVKMLHLNPFNFSLLLFSDSVRFQTNHQQQKQQQQRGSGSSSNKKLIFFFSLCSCTL